MNVANTTFNNRRHAFLNKGSGLILLFALIAIIFVMANGAVTITTMTMAPKATAEPTAKPTAEPTMVTTPPLHHLTGVISHGGHHSTVATPATAGATAGATADTADTAATPTVPPISAHATTTGGIGNDAVVGSTDGVSHRRANSLAGEYLRLSRMLNNKGDLALPERKPHRNPEFIHNYSNPSDAVSVDGDQSPTQQNVIIYPPELKWLDQYPMWCLTAEECYDETFWPIPTATCEPDHEAIEFLGEFLGYCMCTHGWSNGDDNRCTVPPWFTHFNLTMVNSTNMTQPSPQDPPTMLQPWDTLTFWYAFYSTADPIISLYWHPTLDHPGVLVRTIYPAGMEEYAVVHMSTITNVDNATSTATPINWVYDSPVQFTIRFHDAPVDWGTYTSFTPFDQPLRTVVAPSPPSSP